MRKPVCRQHGLDNPADLLAFDAVSQVPVFMLCFILKNWSIVDMKLARVFHLYNVGVVFKTTTLIGLLDLEPCLWDWALPYNRIVVGVLCGHLLSLRNRLFSFSFCNLDSGEGQLKETLGRFHNLQKFCHLQLPRSTSFKSGHKILGHSGKFFFLHPDVRGVFN